MHRKQKFARRKSLRWCGRVVRIRNALRSVVKSTISNHCHKNLYLLQIFGANNSFLAKKFQDLDAELAKKIQLRICQEFIQGGAVFTLSKNLRSVWRLRTGVPPDSNRPIAFLPIAIGCPKTYQQLFRSNCAGHDFWVQLSGFTFK